MLYVSAIARQNGQILYGVTDTDDGATDYLTKNDLLEIAKTLKKTGVVISGVNGKSISVVSMAGQVMDAGFAKIEKQVDALINSWSVETCRDVGRAAHFVSKLKGLSDDEIRRVTKSYVYPSSIRDAVNGAAKISNKIHEIDATDKNAVAQALMDGVCLVLQQKANGTLTSFVGTTNLGVVDALYEPLFFDACYLMKQLYTYTYGASTLRPRNDKPMAKNEDVLKIFSCSLRFRNDGVHHDKGNMVISTPFYGINLNRLFCVYALDNPVKQGDTILGEYQRGKDTGLYEFDYPMFVQIVNDLKTKHNSYDMQQLAKCIDISGLHDGVTVADIADRYARDFNYMLKLRRQGSTFVKNDA